MPREAEPDLDSDVDSLDEDTIKQLQLPEPEPIQIKISALHRVYAHGRINLNPYYQRDVVWPPKRQSGLINSIFNNYYIPPVIFQCIKVQNDVKADAAARDTTLYRTAIDGKQRLSSIINFRAGQIPYIDFRGTVWWYPCKESQGRRGKILTKEMKDKFDNWSLLCIEYTGLSSSQEEELFSRVQQGMALSNAERQMAGHTPWITMVKDLMRVYSDVAHICDELKRGKDFGFMVNVVIMIHYRHKIDAHEVLGLKTTASITEKIIRSQIDGPPTSRFQRRIRKTFAVWADLLETSPGTFTHQFPTTSLKKFSPIEFISTGVLIEMYMDERDNASLIEDIWQMRSYIRSGGKVIDLRTNTQTWAFFWSYIEELGEQPAKRPARRATPPPVAPPERAGPEVPRAKLTLPTKLDAEVRSKQFRKDSVTKSKGSRPSVTVSEDTTGAATEQAVKPVAEPSVVAKTQSQPTSAQVVKTPVPAPIAVRAGPVQEHAQVSVGTSNLPDRQEHASVAPKNRVVSIEGSDEEDDEIFRRNATAQNSNGNQYPKPNPQAFTGQATAPAWQQPAHRQGDMPQTGFPTGNEQSFLTQADRQHISHPGAPFTGIQNYAQIPDGSSHPQYQSNGYPTYQSHSTPMQQGRFQSNGGLPIQHTPEELQYMQKILASHNFQGRQYDRQQQTGLAPPAPFQYPSQQFPMQQQQQQQQQQQYSSPQQQHPEPRMQSRPHVVSDLKHVLSATPPPHSAGTADSRDSRQTGSRRKRIRLGLDDDDD